MSVKPIRILIFQSKRQGKYAKETSEDKLLTRTGKDSGTKTG